MDKFLKVLSIVLLVLALLGLDFLVYERQSVVWNLIHLARDILKPAGLWKGY